MAFAVRRALQSGLMVWFVITLVGIYFVYNLKNHIKFGIDLVGGTYITLEVQVDKAIENELFEKTQQLIFASKKDINIAPVSHHVEGRGARLTFADDGAAREFVQHAQQQGSKLSIARDGSTVTLGFTDVEVRMIVDDAIQSNISVLRTRIDQMGVGEITIAAQGDKNIVVELPNVHNPEQAKAMIGKSALLEFKIVEDEAATEEELLNKFGGELPGDLMILPGKGRHGEKEFYVVSRHAEVTGKSLKTASANPYGGDFGTEPVVNFVFKSEGGERFHELTSQNIGRQLAIIIDNVVIMAPVVRSALRNEGQISGNFSVTDAQDLSMLLRSGAFVAPVKFAEERHIGPSLGAESIRQGLISCLIGLLLLFVFSLVVYKVAGLLASVVLVYNLLLILFMLSWLGAALTLPGIAGMILTIGMAIDASILIYERMREELVVGASLRKAVDIGFSGAMAVILDANVTHFLVALVLYKLGAGPIQGFAITMIVGIVSTLLTGLWLLKSIFNFLIDVCGVRSVKI